MIADRQRDPAAAAGDLVGELRARCRCADDQRALAVELVGVAVVDGRDLADMCGQLLAGGGDAQCAARPGARVLDAAAPFRSTDGSYRLVNGLTDVTDHPPA